VGAAQQRRNALRLSAAFAAGASLNLAFAPIGWWPLGLLAPAALFALIQGVPPRRAAWVGAAFGMGLFAFGTYWLYTCLHVFGLVPVWLTLVLQCALVGAMSAYPAVLCYAANRWWLKAAATRDWLVLPALWVLLEWLRGWVLSGFPWLSLGYAFIDSPLAGWAPLLGVYGVTWAAAVVASSLNVMLTAVHAAAREKAARTAAAHEPNAASTAAASAPELARSAAGRLEPQEPPTPLTPTALRPYPLERAFCHAAGSAAAALAALAALFAVPLSLARHPWTQPTGPVLPIAAVQGAVSQNQKWQLDNRDATLARYAALTVKAWGARLIVWPESALPVLANDIPDYLHELRSAGRAHDADFAIGLVDYQPETGRYFNGLLVMSAAGDGWYFKRHLVPFGEYFPVPRFIRSWMRLMSLPYDDIAAGAEQQPVLGAAGQKLGLTICYEDAFGSSQLTVLREATLLINVTNNAWFGDSAAPFQHLEIARMRALEAGRFLVFASNDGITAAIDARGAVIARLPQFTEAVLRADVQPMTGLTPYARLGNYPLVSGSLGLLGLAVWRRRRGD
jgi:apolipoprotein N-acyltransferase